MADVSIDETARIERVRYNTQTGGFAGNPDSGYAWHWINGTGTYSGVFVENDQGDIFGPFVDYNEGARVYNSGNIEIANGTATNLTFDSERYDTDNIHSTTANTDRLTCRTPGKYLIIGNIHWDANPTGTRITSIYLNGSDYIGSYRTDPSADAEIGHFISTIYNLSVDDYVTLTVYQNSGGALDVEKESSHSLEFMMQRIGY